MQYYKNGDLRSFMIRNKWSFVNLVLDGKLDFHQTDMEQGHGSSSASICDNGLVKFTTRDLIRWAEGVAAGMEYLAEKRVCKYYSTAVLPVNHGS